MFYGLLARAQSTEVALPKNSIGISLGFEQVKELNLHPKVHSGLSCGISYSRFTQKQNVLYQWGIFDQGNELMELVIHSCK